MHVRIALDGLPLTETLTGVGNYTLELARALSILRPNIEFEVVAPRTYLSEIDLGNTRPNLKAVQVQTNAATRHWWSIGLPSYIHKNSLALFHGTNFEVPLRGPCPTVVTIHDLSLLRHSTTHKTRAVWRGRMRLPLMSRKATMLITPSEAVRREVCSEFELDPDRVVGIPLAPSPMFRRVERGHAEKTLRRLGVEDQFLLFVGTIEPRKNVLTLLQAFERLIRSTDLRPQLIIAGRVGWKAEQVLSYVNRPDLRDKVRVIGYVSKEELCSLYSACVSLIYPSIHEGFGLPPLEAMACGAPVIASSVPSINQKVARVVPVTDIDSLTEAMVQLLTEPSTRATLAELGMKHAATFSWQRTAELTFAVYEEALSRAKG